MRVNKDVVQMERSRHNRGENMPGLHPLAAEYTTKEKRIELYGILKGQNSLMIFQKHGNMKFAYRNREFWCKGYYVDTLGKNTKAIKEVHN